MSPNGRRAWREWMRKANPRRKLRPPTHTICRLAREGRRHIGPIPPATPKPFTPRSLVGMTQGARKRRWAKDFDALPPSGRASKTVSMLRAYGVFPKDGNPLAQRIRPCPGCCACWGCSAVTILGEITECCGPKTRGKSRRQIRAMRKWEARMWDDCDGSGVRPARKETA